LLIHVINETMIVNLPYLYLTLQI